MTLFVQLSEMVLECIATRTGQRHDVTDRHSSVLTRELNNSQRKFRHLREDNLLSFDLFGKTQHLLLESAQEEDEPRLPVWRFGSDCALCLSEGKVIALLALLDNTLQ